MSKEAMKLALEALLINCGGNTEGKGKEAITALREALANEALDKMAENARELGLDYETAQQEPVRVPVTDSTYNYAKSLAEAIFKQHFASDEHYSSGRIVWGVNDTVIGILTQIDNMVADMVRKPAQQEPVAWLHPANATCVTTDPTAYARGIPLYTSPQAQRTWVGLTGDEWQAIVEDDSIDTIGAIKIAIEAKLKEKNT